MASRIQARLPKRQILLFLLVLATPCLVLTGLGLRMHQQDRQLASRRAEEARRQQLAQFRSELLSTLERVKHQSMGRRAHDAVVLVAAVREGRLVVPFEVDPSAMRFRKSLTETDFGARIRRGEREEIVERRLDQAAEQYRAALRDSKQPWERAYASLLLGRTLQKAGRQAEARNLFKTVLLSPAAIRDEHGIPLALYAAPVLWKADKDAGAIQPVVRALAGEASGLGSPALHRLREVAVETGASDLIPALDRWIADREQAEALQADFPRLAAKLQGDEPVWIPYGEPMWLVGLAGEAGLVAVRAAGMPGLLGRSAEQARLAQGKQGESLGEAFPGLRVLLAEVPPQEGARSTLFLTLSLALVMALTLLAGYLLWRDVRRDARLAALRSQFVSSVSHELRTPLTSIRLFSENMRLDDQMDPETRAEYLDTVLHESERLSRLVDNVLRFARMEQGRARYDLRPVSLAEVVASAVGGFRRLAEHAGFRLEVEAAPDLPPALADRDALEQAILNLLSNAVKYSGASREIALRLERQDGYAAIHVTDHGVGIPPGEQRRIFERFYRVETSENRQIPGTGLGLTLVDHIAAAHGGSVSVRSRPGEGSTFTIRVPL